MRIFVLLATFALIPSLAYSQSFLDNIEVSFAEEVVLLEDHNGQKGSAASQAPYRIPHKKILDGAYWTAVAFMSASKALDIESTFYAINNGAVEANPIMKPFVNSGRHATYVVSAAVIGAASAMTYKLKKETKLWWIFPLGITVTQTLVGIRNLRVIQVQ